MIKREPVLPPELLYPIEAWRWVERSFAPQFVPQAETIFTVANGYLGVRGAFEDGEPAYQHGAFVNGFHETWPIPYGEWALEMYVLPFLIYTSPGLARNILRYRYGILDRARARARSLGQKGASFPWRTINGEEASAYYAAGTAQYHINAAIAHAVVKYVDITGDREFLHECGPRCWWRRPGCGTISDSSPSARTAASASTASPGQTSTPRWSTTTRTPT
jgi:trehalose/maltose hydrolase-like predicted phosphorylase